MLNATRLRISLAVVTLAGAFHLDSAQAAEPLSVGPCDTYADGYAAGFCAARGGRPAEIVYTCNPDGTITVHSVSCIQPT
jgi:hypothetical protein